MRPNEAVLARGWCESVQLVSYCCIDCILRTTSVSSLVRIECLFTVNGVVVVDFFHYLYFRGIKKKIFFLCWDCCNYSEISVY